MRSFQCHMELVDIHICFQEILGMSACPCTCGFSHMEKASVNEHNSLFVWNLMTGRTVEQGAGLGHNKHENKKAVKSLIYLAELVRQSTEKCF